MRSPSFSHRANVVIGDIFVQGAQAIVDAINKLPPGSGKACWKRCDVTSWEDQVTLFEFAMTKFGGVDIVVSDSYPECVAMGY
jgi:NAD(P)-dependent dehydrogenase (short-subunit alcohol dehydrogenase family)